MSRARTKTPLRDLATYGRTHAVRLTNYTYSGNADIHVTMCADRGRPFDAGSRAHMVCASVERSIELCRYRLHGYCLMPDHLHVLLSPAESGLALKHWLRRFKSFTTNEAVRLGVDAPLWQESANDHVCRTAETAEVVLAYIVNNPVRAGLAARWQDWPWTKVFIEI